MTRLRPWLNQSASLTPLPHLLSIGHGGLVQACSLKLPLRQYIWSPPLPTAVYHGYELNDLAQLTVNPCEPEILAGVSSDGVLALWNLDRWAGAGVGKAF